MPRKQRFKPTRKPKLTTEGPIERTQDQQPNRVSNDESSPRNEEPNSDRRD